MLRTLALLLVLAVAAAAQSSPFLSQDLYRHLSNEISGDIAYDHLRNLTQYHAPSGNTRGFWEAARWIEAKARETGLEDIRVIEMPDPDPVWNASFGEAWLIEPGPGGKPIELKLGSFREIATHIADNSRPTNVEAELIDVGAGNSDADYMNKDVKGKVVLASGPPTQVMEQAVWKRGAAGILSYSTSRVVPSDHPDQVAWQRVQSRGDGKGNEPTFAFVISYRQAQQIRTRLAGMATTDYFAPAHKRQAAAGPVKVRVQIKSEIGANGRHGIVEGWIRGASRANAATAGDQQIVLTAHIQEERFSANDDRSGCANLLEVARALVRMINEGKIERPQRDIRFWWVDEISGPYNYFSINPDERARIFVNINEDMVGGHQTVGGVTRVQHVTRTPWSRPTFFNDVVENIIGMLHSSNNSYLAARQAGSGALGSIYPNPIFSRMGSRDRYAVEIVPYFGNSDHLVFNDASIGTLHGGVTFIEWPDEYIHSSHDDIWQSDQTTLKRNAVAWAALALTMANFGPNDVPALTSMVVPGALARVQQDLRAATSARLGGAATAWDVDNMAAVAVEREYAVIDSIRSVGANDARTKQFVDQALEAFWASATSVSESLPSYYRPPTAAPKRNAPAAKAPAQTPAAAQEKAPATAQARKNPTPEPDSPLKAAMSAQVPQRIANLKEYRDRIDGLDSVPALHGLMRFEALNFADGRRSVWDIYSAVRAQSLAAGEWYYGRVTPEMIQQLFASAVKTGAFTWKAAATKK